jgi:hypothetical protein
VAQNRPALLGYSPTEGTQGTTVTLTFTGANFSPKLPKLFFTPSQGITVANVAAVSGKQIVAQVQIASTAAVGSYRVDLQDADHDMIASAPFQVVAAQQSPPACPPGMPNNGCGAPPVCPGGLAANGACGTVAPVIKEMSPLSGKQGTTVLLTLDGANFVANETLQPLPATGLTVGNVTLVNANEVQAQIAIAANAPLGPRAVTLVTGKQRTQAPNTFTVTPGYAIVSESPMQILRVVPSQIVAGSQNVDIAIEGTNFQPGTLVTFSAGAGIPAAVMAMGPARYVNSTEIHVLVTALATALPGGRDITLQTTQGLKITAPRMLDVIAPTVSTGPPPSLKITPINLQNFPMGKIVLDDPQWGDQWQGEIEEHYGIPEFDDDLRFQWHEQNPGLADYYVLNIYAKDGTTLLGSKRINGVEMPWFGGTLKMIPNYFRPDTAFIAQVLEYVSPIKLLPMQAHSDSTPTIKYINGVKMFGPPAPSRSTPQLAEGDMQWEVVGYHTYNSNGVAPQAANPPAKSRVPQSFQESNVSVAQNTAMSQSSQPQTADVEVEVSDRWPLNRSKAPTGMSCPAGGFGGGLTAQDIDITGSDPNTYAGDRFALSGSFDLTDSPYAAHPNPIDAPCATKGGGPCLVKSVAQESFDNLFVDWGDGTIQRISAVPKDPNMTNWNRGEVMRLPVPNSPSSSALTAEGVYFHAYANAGGYKIRVFQLSEADAQHLNPSVLSASIDGPGGSPFLQAATLGRLVMPGSGASSSNTVGDAFQSVLTQGATPVSLQSGGAPPPSSGNAPAGPDLSAISSRAFMIFCDEESPTVLEDHVADGQLHLKSIADPTFPGHDNSTAPHLAPIHMGAPGAVLGNAPSAKGAAKTAEPLHLSNADMGTGPGGSSASQGKEKMAAIREGLGGSNSPTADATCSTCDDAAVAQSVLGFYGQGEVRVTWHVDGTTMQQTFAVGPSQARHLTRQPAPPVVKGGLLVLQTGPPIIVSDSPPFSPYFDTPSPLTTKALGMHSVSVEADIAPDPALPNLPLGVREGLSKIAGDQGKGIDAAASAQAQSVLNSLSPPPGSNLPPLKVGILSSSNRSLSGLGSVQYVNDALDKIVKLTPPNPPPDSHVASNTRHYEVVQADPNKPCKFLFPVTSGGAFEVEDLQLTGQSTQYSGSGNLVVHLANQSSGGYDIYPPVPIKFSNWSVPDGLTVTSGTFDVSPGITLRASAPGVKGTLDRIQGHAGGAAQGEVDATMSLTLADDTLRQPGEAPVSWDGVTSELHANGDWIKDGLTMPTTLIGWSAFQMQSSDVRIDMSHSAGDAGGYLCSGLSGGDWVGVRFPTLTIIPYTMGLVSSSALAPTVNDWGIVGHSLCGSLVTPQPFHTAYESGSVAFQKLVATAQPGQGDFSATYYGMDIYVPWLDTHITGDAHLQSGGGQQASITFPTGASAVTKTYGNISFTAKNLEFTQVLGHSWAVQTSTAYTFTSEGKTFATIPLTPFYFGMDGRAYLANGATSIDVPLGGSSTLGPTPVDLVSAHINMPINGDQVFSAQFSTHVHLSEVMPAAPMQVNYAMTQSGTNFTAQGPQNSPFTLDLPYPSGQPTSEATIHPVYNGGSNNGGNSNGGTSEYSGSVDLSELGGPPVTGQFRLGYGNGHDYWIARATIGFGDMGIPIVDVPVPVMNLYSVSGGMGHNFPLNAFTDTGDLNAASPVYDNSFLFYAGMRVGMPDHFTYTLDGDLTIKATGQNAGARMDFHAWLLKPPDNGNGDFQGYFQYAGGNFDGRLWGHLDFMDGLASLDMGNSANNAAVDIHFGNGPWHVDAGKKEGPRIHGHFLVSDADMYVMLSDQGLAIGGSESFDLDVGDDSVASAYVKAGVDAGLAITPQPHISADFSANASAGVCVSGVCVSGSVNAQIHAEALPLEMDASASLGLPWPLGSVSFSVHL